MSIERNRFEADRWLRTALDDLERVDLAPISPPAGDLVCRGPTALAVVFRRRRKEKDVQEAA